MITPERLRDLLDPPRGYVNPNARDDFTLILTTWQVDAFGAEQLTEWCQASGFSWTEVRPE